MDIGWYLQTISCNVFMIGNCNYNMKTAVNIIMKFCCIICVVICASVMVLYSGVPEGDLPSIGCYGGCGILLLSDER